jgi:hypothetical protein
MKSGMFAALMILSSSAYGADVHDCASSAREQAHKLLAFHFGADERIEIDNSVEVIAPLRNPANKNQVFDVLEVWGYIYKGRYRMRFIYAQSPEDCLLMGQEILEHASL